MANWSNNFPEMGDGGEKPPDGQDWQGGEQVNEKHLDYLWDQIEKTVDNILAHTLQDDGSVHVENDTYLQWHGQGGGSIDAWKINTADELETAVTVNLGNDLVATNGETIWDESETHIPIARFEENAITITAGDGLDGGGTPQLGSSTSLSVDPSDFAGSFLTESSGDLVVGIHDSLRDDGSGNIRVDETYGMNWSAQQQFSSGIDTRADIVDDTTVIWDSSDSRIGNDRVQEASINTNAVKTDALDLSITPTWTGLHSFDSGIDITSSDGLKLDGNLAMQSVPVSGQVTLSSGSAEVDTGITATDATFMPAVGVDDPNADVKVSARLFWDDDDGSYHIEFIETGTSVDNPTVNYDVIRVR